jgi:hypothetical protein
MNRRQYARGSGIIIDVCRKQGMWFDAEELAAVLDWISRGGLSKDLVGTSGRTTSQPMPTGVATAIIVNRPATHSDPFEMVAMQLMGAAFGTGRSRARFGVSAGPLSLLIGVVAIPLVVVLLGLATLSASWLSATNRSARPPRSGNPAAYVRKTSRPELPRNRRSSNPAHLARTTPSGAPEDTAPVDSQAAETTSTLADDKQEEAPEVPTRTAVAADAKREADETPGFRTWTDSTGRFSVNAQFVGHVDGKVKLKREDGRVIEVDLARLTVKDQQYVKEKWPDPQ